jgi:stage V sporulation protein R
MDLKLDEARDTLRNLFTVWQRPVHLETISDEETIMLSFDGKEHTEK